MSAAVRAGAGVSRTRRMAVAMGALLALYGAWQLLRWPGAQRALVGDVFFVPVGLAAAGAAWSASHRCAADARRRSAWRIVTAALVASLMGDTTHTIYELTGTDSFPSFADVFYLALYPLMLAGVLRFPVAVRSASEWLRIWLDLLIVAIGASAVVMYVYLGPTLEQATPDALQTGVSVAYPVGDMVLLIGLALVPVRRTADSSTRSLGLLGAGLLLYVIADTVYGYLALHSAYHGGDPIDTLWMVAIALFALAGAAQPRARGSSGPNPVSEYPRAAWAPYLAVGVAFGLLILSERGDSLLPAMMLSAAVVMMVVISIRQYLARVDLMRTRSELTWQSLHDPLTGLPNRILVTDRAAQMLARSRRNSTTVSALCIDLDDFKEINHRLGQAGGDEVLRAVARRLEAIVRGADTAGRLGGDEFVVLIEDLGGGEDPEMVAERVRGVLEAPIEVAGRLLSVSASVGVAVGQPASADELLGDASSALAQAKAGGPDRCTVFQSAIEAASHERLELEIALRGALERGELHLVYQPVYDLRSERMAGVEALIRWRHPQRGTVPPDVFVPLAEECGLIVPIGRWVLESACAQAARWASGGHRLGMAVNISARQLEHAGIVAEVAGALERSGIPPATLTLEITETALMADSHASARRIAELKALGVRIAIDDFGTGYCSLSYLREFRVDAIKIDRSFVSGIAASEESRALVHTLVALGASLGLQTTGEGIEERAQLRQLRDEGCDYGQGYLLARPLDPDGVSELLDPVATAAV